MDRTGRPETNDMGEASRGSFNLARAPLASELRHDLIDVRHSRLPQAGAPWRAGPH